MRHRAARALFAFGAVRASDDRQAYRHVVARRVRVRADLVRLFDERLRVRFVDARQRHAQLDIEREAAGVVRTEPDLGSHLRIGRQRLLALAGDELHRAQKARRIACGEELFGIRAFRAGAAELTRCGELDLQLVIFGHRATVAAAGARGARLVQSVHRAAPVREGEAVRVDSIAGHGVNIEH